MLSYHQIAGQRIGRIEALTDGVFAIAMTLLVLNLTDRNATKLLSDSELLYALKELAPNFLSFFLSFLTLGIFWIGHVTQYDFINRYNRTLTWISIVFLMFVSILPFTTSILSNHSNNKVAVLLYWLNILLIGISSFYHWEVAHRLKFLTPKFSRSLDLVKLFRRRTLVAQLLYAVGAALCFLSTTLSIYFIIAVQLNIAFTVFSKRSTNKAKDYTPDKN